MSQIDEPLILKVLEPIWDSKTETASRLRGRIEKVLDTAKVKKQRTGENPARWRGNLEILLAKPREIKKAKNHAALPYADLPAFMTELRKRPAPAARALEWTILTAARTGETKNAKRGRPVMDRPRSEFVRIRVQRDQPQRPSRPLGSSLPWP